MMMKLSYLLLPLLLFARCAESTAPTDPSGGSLSASIDGAPYASSRANATFAGGMLSITSERVTYAEEYAKIDLNLSNVTQAKEYEIGPLSGNSGHVKLTDSNYYTPLLPGNNVIGSVTITRLDNASVAGRFHFIAYANAGGPPDDSVSVTDGVFDVKITR